MMISATYLNKEYIQKKLSARQISKQLNCSENTVTYWLQKHKIQKRTISDAVYVLANPSGNPFKVQKINSNEDFFILGLGLGLFWGEGNKANKNCVRIGNSDPSLIKIFILFLESVYKIDKNKLRFGLQIFDDTDPEEALKFWQDYLCVPPKYFYKPIITKSTKVGTYGKKNKNGVMTLYFSNTKLRDIIVDAIKELQNGKLPS